MGLFKEYIAMGASLPPQLDQLRREQLARIGSLLNSSVISYASRIAQLPPQVDISISYDDILPFTDVLSGVTGDRVTVVIETPGGFGEVGKSLVELLHERFSHVAFLVPGTAKSTGTIMCLGGHEIIMGPGSSLGPIDAQLTQDGKRFSADALLEGLERIKDEVERTLPLRVFAVAGVKSWSYIQQSHPPCATVQGARPPKGGLCFSSPFMAKTCVYSWPKPAFT